MTRAALRLAIVSASVLVAGMTLVAAPSVVQASTVAVAAGCAQPASQQSIPAPTGTPWWASRLGLDHVAGLSLGEGQVVAVLDTGVAPVPALDGALRTGIDLVPADPRSAAALADSSIVGQDCDGRGTVMAGLVAARRGPGLELPGLARAADILPVRVLASARDTAEPSVLAEGISAAVAAGASVVLVGSAVRDDPALRSATHAALDAGIPVVAAAGDGEDVALAFPAGYDGVIAVSATGTADAAAPVNAAGLISVGAPGTDIVGLGLDGGVVGGQAGSALAAALVAATIADLRASFPDLTPQQLDQRLIVTADRPGSAVPDPTLGWGVVNPVTALTAPFAAAPLVGTAVAAAPASAAPSRPGAVTVTLPPEPADNSWAVVVAAMLLVVAAAAAAAVAGVRRARTRGWRPAAAGNSMTEPSINPGELGEEAARRISQ